ncbi:flavin reductase family protein [Geminicoccus harenae]|uniref:flavin reductase family protein n=1 Tax=Geminicoccus harenae TaxID=2498453 RepID=UPI00168AD4B1|nr:flavin reductase family protein [Geminicoccus harenae]
MSHQVFAADLRDQFEGAMHRVASSVSVVTTDGDAGRFGVTVSAMTAVSSAPPMLLVCVPRDNPLASALLANGAFAVNVLAADQVEIAACFSGKPLQGRPYEFRAGQWREMPATAPVLVGAAASFTCTLLEAHEGGTHSIFIGAVGDAEIGAGEPLLYGNRLYGRHTVFEPGRVHLCGNA